MDFTTEQIMASMKEMLENSMARNDISHLGNLLDGLDLRQAVDTVEYVWGRDSEQFRYMLGHYNVDQTTVFRGRRLTDQEVDELKVGAKVWLCTEIDGDGDFDIVATVTSVYPGFVVVMFGGGFTHTCWRHQGGQPGDVAQFSSGTTLYRVGL